MKFAAGIVPALPPSFQSLLEASVSVLPLVASVVLVPAARSTVSWRPFKLRTTWPLVILAPVTALFSSAEVVTESADSLDELIDPPGTVPASAANCALGVGVNGWRGDSAANVVAVPLLRTPS